MSLISVSSSLRGLTLVLGQIPMSMKLSCRLWSLQQTTRCHTGIYPNKQYTTVSGKVIGITFSGVSIQKGRHTVISVRCNIYISRLCYDASVRLSVHLSVTEVHWHIIDNWGFKFRSHFSAHCSRCAACGRHAACGRIISHHASQC